VQWNKGYEDSELTTEIIDHYMALPFPKAIHFRLATHGGTTRELTHPFPIKRGVPHSLKGEANAVLFHNGVWASYDDRLREAIFGGTLNPSVLDGQMSDSRAMAILAQRFGLNVFDIMSMGSNKILILGERYVTYGSWVEKEGWSASSSKIFCEPTKPSSGVALGKSGLPVLSKEQLREAARLGHLNRHGNLRSRFRGGRVSPTVGSVDSAHGQVDDKGEQPIRLMGKTDIPTQSSLYLSATVEEIRNMSEWWGVRERLN
jgi:hypothetical protein